jgi:hypothetical protein
MLGAMGTAPLGAADPPPVPPENQRDFSSEAEAARHSDRFEALRDPEMRRHYLDQVESRKWQNYHPPESIDAQFVPAPRGGNSLELPAEIRQLQKALGGSQVDQFPSLRSDGFSPLSQPGRESRQPRSSERDVIRALRDAATQLDATANRLEQLDLYRQADGLRHQAQQLRIDARGLSGDPQTTPTPSVPLPTSWSEGPVPTLQPQPMHSDPSILPEVTPLPTLDATPIPTPTPAADPQIPDNQPKPQPLNDAPTSPPKAAE